MDDDDDTLAQVAKELAFNLVGSMFTFERGLIRDRGWPLTRNERADLSAMMNANVAKQIEADPAMSNCIAALTVQPDPREPHAMRLTITAATGEIRRYKLAALAVPLD